MNTVKILAFAGSLRTASFNKKLVKISAQGAEEAGATTTFIDLKDFPLPHYDGDIEEKEGFPENALTLKRIFEEHDGFLIASPEYNSGYSSALKNTIDWVSRPASQNEPMLKAFSGKHAAIMATSPGALGGLRGLFQLRELLMNIQITVSPTMRAVGQAFDVFDENGLLKESKLDKQIKSLGAHLAHTVSLTKGN